MSEKEITRFLHILGLSKREIQVYMFLAKSGIQSTSFVAKRLKMERVQAYRTFKKLQEKGFIEATIERPTRFTIVPFEKLLESFVEAKKSEIDHLNEQKESLLSAWQSVSAPESEYPVAKFSVVTGKKKIHARMLNMIDEAQREVYILTTSLGVIQEDIAGVFDSIIGAAEEERAKFKILTEISPENLNVIERISKSVRARNAKVEWRHLNLSSKFFPRFLIKDEEESILYASAGDTASVLNLEDEGLWINDKMFISILKAFFAQMWQSGVEAEKRIEELKTGIPIGETIIIKDSQEAWAKLAKVLEGAKEDAIAITSSVGLNAMLENDPFAEYCQDGLKCRIMAQIDLDNLEAARKLSKCYEIKHVPINYLAMMVVDNSHLFMFKTPPLEDLDVEDPFYTTDTFYTNDPKQIERVSEMLDDIWKRGIEISEIGSEAGMKIPSIQVAHEETVPQLVDKMLRNNVSSVLIIEDETPIGIISDKDLLKSIVKNRRDPNSLLVKELDYTPIIMLDDGKSMTDAIKTMHEQN